MIEQLMTNQITSEIVPLRTSGRKPSLFCVHEGNFQQMAAAMPADYSVYGLRWSNPEESFVSASVEQIVASHLQEIHKIQNHGPYQLIGYSFGGLIAYEMGRLLVNSGEDVSLLALIDTIHPHFQRNLSPGELKQFRKAYFASRLSKYSKNALQGRFDLIWSDASHHLLKKITPVVWKITRSVSGLGHRLPVVNASNTSEPSVWAYNASRQHMWNSYTPTEFRGRLVLFRVEQAMDAGEELDSDPSLGWNKYAEEGVDLQYVAGGHGTVLQPPNVQKLIEKLLPYLASTIQTF